jgi:hypothetical protein
MKANELQELGVEEPLTRDKARKLEAKLEQQIIKIIKFLSFKSYAMTKLVYIILIF